MLKYNHLNQRRQDHTKSMQDTFDPSSPFCITFHFRVTLDFINSPLVNLLYTDFISMIFALACMG